MGQKQTTLSTVIKNEKKHLVAAGDLTEDEVLNEREVCMRRSQILYTRYDKLDMSLSYWEKAKMGRLY